MHSAVLIAVGLCGGFVLICFFLTWYRIHYWFIAGVLLFVALWYIVTPRRTRKKS